MLTHHQPPKHRVKHSDELNPVTPLTVTPGSSSQQLPLLQTSSTLMNLGCGGPGALLTMAGDTPGPWASSGSHCLLRDRGWESPGTSPSSAQGTGRGCCQQPPPQTGVQHIPPPIKSHLLFVDHSDNSNRTSCLTGSYVGAMGLTLGWHLPGANKHLVLKGDLTR